LNRIADIVTRTSHTSEEAFMRQIVPNEVPAPTPSRVLVSAVATGDVFEIGCRRFEVVEITPPRIGDLFLGEGGDIVKATLRFSQPRPILRRL
jgi:hypothetical protein